MHESPWWRTYARTLHPEPRRESDRGVLTALTIILAGVGVYAVAQTAIDFGVKVLARGSLLP